MHRVESISIASESTKVSKRSRRRFEVASAIAVAMLSYARSIHADIPYAWTGNSTTNKTSFTTGGNWVPATVPNSSISAVTISKAGTYTVNLTQSDTVDTLALTDSGLTFNQTAGTLTANSINASAGVLYNMENGATLAAAGTGNAGILTVNSSAQFDVYQGTISNYNLANGTSINVLGFNYLSVPSLIVTGNMNCSGNAAMNVSEGVLEFSGTQTIDGVTISLNLPYFANSYITAGTGTDVITLGPRATIEGAGNIFGTTLLNTGSIVSNVSGQTMNISATNFTNSGQLSVTNDGLLELQGNWSNTGTITGSQGSAIELGGTFTPAVVGNINANGAAVVITGTLNNSNSTFSLASSVSGTVNGGTLDPVGGGLSVGGSFGANATLNGVQVIGDLYISSYGYTIISSAGLTVTGNVSVSGNLQFAGAQTFDNANIVLESVSNGGITAGVNGDNTAVLTLGSHVNITGDGNLQGNSIINNGTITSAYSDNYGNPIDIHPTSFTNHGNINAAGSLVYIAATTWSNDGTITGTSTGSFYASNSGFDFSGSWSNTGTVTLTGSPNLDLGGTFAAASLSGISNTGTTNISGTLDNTNASLVVDGTLGTLSLSGTINNGTVEIKPGQSLAMVVSAEYDYVVPSINAGLTIDAGATLVGAGNISGASLINHGTLSTAGSSSNFPLNINSGTFFNDGTINLAGGVIQVNATLDVGAGTLTGSGTLLGDLQLDNDPSTLSLAVYNSSQFTTISVNGDVTLGGYLTIDLPDGIDPSLISSDVFDVLTNSGMMSGSFLNVASGGRLETADGLGSFEVDYGGSGTYADEIVLSNFQPTSVPEPASLGMLSVLGVALLARRRRFEISSVT